MDIIRATIGSVNGPASSAAAGFPAPKLDKAAKIHAAATQFEAIMIGQMMQSAHSAGGSAWMGTDGDQNSALAEFGEQQFAQALAASGGLGLAKMVIAGLEKNANR